MIVPLMEVPVKNKIVLIALFVLSVSALGFADTAPAADLSWLVEAPVDAAVSSCCVTSQVQCELTCLRPPNCGVGQFSCSSTSLTTCNSTCRCFFCE